MSKVHKSAMGMGREVFAGFRSRVGRADQGALSIDWHEEEAND